MSRPVLLGRHRRRDFARAALVVWVVGFELAPGLHLLLHEYLAAHEHGPVVRTGPSRTRETRAVDTGAVAHHQHDGGAWHSHDDAPGGDHHPPSDGPDPIDPDHGAGSLAHRMLAAVEPPPVAVPERGELIAPPPAPHRLLLPLRSAAPLQPSVRGPPLQLA